VARHDIPPQPVRHDGEAAHPPAANSTPGTRPADGVVPATPTARHVSAVRPVRLAGDRTGDAVAEAAGHRAGHRTRGRGHSARWPDAGAERATGTRHHAGQMGASFVRSKFPARTADPRPTAFHVTAGGDTDRLRRTDSAPLSCTAVPTGRATACGQRGATGARTMGIFPRTLARSYRPARGTGRSWPARGARSPRLARPWPTPPGPLVGAILGGHSVRACAAAVGATPSGPQPRSFQCTAYASTCDWPRQPGTALEALSPTGWPSNPDRRRPRSS
jgi:hypothetical protein